MRNQCCHTQCTCRAACTGGKQKCKAVQGGTLNLPCVAVGARSTLVCTALGKDLSSCSLPSIFDVARCCCTTLLAEERPYLEAVEMKARIEVGFSITVDAIEAYGTIHMGTRRGASQCSIEQAVCRSTAMQRLCEVCKMSMCACTEIIQWQNQAQVVCPRPEWRLHGRGTGITIDLNIDAPLISRRCVTWHPFRYQTNLNA